MLAFFGLTFSFSFVTGIGNLKGEKLKYNGKCSFFEIYNEQITDLLDPSATNFLLREDVKKGGVYMANFNFEVVISKFFK
ncbi:hypothetical protein HRI_002240600 [Hibiscus trionum]|uniref:Kinesin motor domain-containing protein n=1 Tax=Hibiscus trionum TaxID=183268 RepID=A0A9W7M2U6_HIBTR|nr:hypothetical protein HRI_002240600 [Hibiscus trionum]